MIQLANIRRRLTSIFLSRSGLVITLSLVGLIALGNSQMFNSKTKKFETIKNALLALRKDGDSDAHSQTIANNCDHKLFPIKGGVASAFADVYILVNPTVNQYQIGATYRPISLGSYSTYEIVFFDLQSTPFDPLAVDNTLLGALAYRGDRVYVVDFSNNRCGYYDRGAYVRF